MEKGIRRKRMRRALFCFLELAILSTVTPIGFASPYCDSYPSLEQFAADFATEEYKDSYYKIQIKAGDKIVGAGTATLIDSSGLLISAKHLLGATPSEQKQMAAQIESGTAIATAYAQIKPGKTKLLGQARVDHVDPALDFALFRIDPSTLPIGHTPVPITFGDDIDNQPLIIMGFPVDKFQLSAHEVRDSVRLDIQENVIRAKTSAYHGQSGSLVINRDGHGVGVLIGSYNPAERRPKDYMRADEMDQGFYDILWLGAVKKTIFSKSNAKAEDALTRIANADGEGEALIRLWLRTNPITAIHLVEMIAHEEAILPKVKDASDIASLLKLALCYCSPGTLDGLVIALNSQRNFAALDEAIIFANNAIELITEDFRSDPGIHQNDINADDARRRFEYVKALQPISTVDRSYLANAYYDFFRGLRGGTDDSQEISTVRLDALKHAWINAPENPLVQEAVAVELSQSGDDALSSTMFARALKNESLPLEARERLEKSWLFVTGRLARTGTDSDLRLEATRAISEALQGSANIAAEQSTASEEQVVEQKDAWQSMDDLSAHPSQRIVLDAEAIEPLAPSESLERAIQDFGTQGSAGGFGASSR